MARTVGIGKQDFEKIISRDCFYIDKTMFIKEWWENDDEVTLITRPRRFGKTLNMSMTEQFFSLEYADRKDIFKNMSIWEEERYRELQGTYPVIALTFADVKENDFMGARQKLCMIIRSLYDKYDFLLDSGCLKESEIDFYRKISPEMPDYIASYSLKSLSLYLSRYYQKKVIILLDEYDTPLQEAYINDYWEEMVRFIGNLFNATFKTNPYLDKAIMTGITRVSKESVFSELNNLTVVSTTSDMYMDCFGFTEDEVYSALEEYGLSNQMSVVKRWYDGFTFGRQRDIYNPWSILNYLKTKKLDIYWANTSSNQLVGDLIREGSVDVKVIMEDLLCGKTFHTQIDEQIVFQQLAYTSSAIWSLLLATGYLKVEKFYFNENRGKKEYDLALTNTEIRFVFEQIVEGWFSNHIPAYNEFIKALLSGNIKGMNSYINKVALTTFSYFDAGKKPSEDAEPERLPTGKAITKSLKEPNSSVCFYHGFVLGLMVDLADRYTITSNRESGLGRYDVVLEPRTKGDDAIILEFKVYNPDEESTLQDTVNSALKQIEDKRYAVTLEAKGIREEKIRKYGFAFEGKTVLIGC